MEITTESESKHKILVERGNTEGCFFQGRRASLGGWKNNYCTLSTSKPGFYHVSWEVVEAVLNSESKTFTSEPVLSSMAWLGCE